MKRIRIFCITAMLFICTTLKANNIVISNITSVTGSGYVQLQFDLSWENSWNNTINKDAAWVFFKFKDNDGTWRHLSLTNANNSIASGNIIKVPTDLTGAFIFRTSGSGTVTLTGVRLGVTNLPGSFDIKGFAVEMVQIPVDDTYYLGDAGSSFSFGVVGTGTPFLVNVNTLSMNSAGQLEDPHTGFIGSLTNFPIGYNTAGASMNLYMMKHEISQGAYRDFLNTLTYTQQATRTAFAPNSAAGTLAMSATAGTYRNRIKIASSGVSSTTPAVYGCDMNNNGTYNESTDGEWIACNFLSYMDVAAFLDWAALRPMTEMEFEKACRGPLTAVSLENAAGTAAYAATTYPISNFGAANEMVTTYSGSVYDANITYTGTAPSSYSPLRVGIHATAYSTRISAGAGYYGCLDLSGNVEEVAATSANTGGRSFTGVSGDGTINAAGDANEDFWPGINGNTNTTVANTAYGGTTGVTGASGIIVRGGSCAASITQTRVSNRITPPGTSTRSHVTGGRGVKSWQ